MRPGHEVSHILISPPSCAKGPTTVGPHRERNKHVSRPEDRQILLSNSIARLSMLGAYSTQAGSGTSCGNGSMCAAHLVFAGVHLEQAAGEAEAPILNMFDE
eukprot:6195620-Pleurochrysis_carterae.AAC.4